MNNKTKKIIMIFLLFFLFSGNAYPKETKTEMIIERLHLDISLKSTRGWIRIFNSERKLQSYGIYISDYEREMLLAYFKEQKSRRNKKYKREIK